MNNATKNSPAVTISSGITFTLAWSGWESKIKKTKYMSVLDYVTTWWNNYTNVSIQSVTFSKESSPVSGVAHSSAIKAIQQKQKLKCTCHSAKV